MLFYTVGGAMKKNFGKTIRILLALSFAGGLIIFASGIFRLFIVGEKYQIAMAIAGAFICFNSVMNASLVPRRIMLSIHPLVPTATPISVLQM